MTQLMFSSKDPAEEITYGVDFTAILGTQTISAASCGISVYTGTDASSASMLLGSASAASGIVRQQIGLGVDGAVYRCEFSCLTSGGDTLIGIGYLPVDTK